jgi:hypothetical protein
LEIKVGAVRLREGTIVKRNPLRAATTTDERVKSLKEI